MLGANYHSKWVCHLCRAHKKIKRLHWTQFRRDSRLRQTRYTNSQFMGWCLGHALYSVLLLIPGFWIWRVWSDAMHGLDLGVYQFAVPSAIWELTRHPSPLFPATTRPARLLLIHIHYKAWCRRHGVANPVQLWEPKWFVRNAQKAFAWTQKCAKAAREFILGELLLKRPTSLFNALSLCVCTHVCEKKIVGFGSGRSATVV